MLSALLKRFSSDLALYVSGDRIYLGMRETLLADEAARVALHKETRRVIAVGNEALAMEGKEPSNIEVVRPFRLGMIWDMDTAEACFRYLIKKYRMGKLVPPRVVVCGHCQGDTAKRAFKEALTHAGAREVLLLEAGIAAAMGCGIQIEKPEFNVVLILERDWLQFSVISLAGSVGSAFAPIGFDDLLQDIALYANEALALEPDLPSLEATVRSNGFALPAALVGWQTWIDSLERGREAASSLAPGALAAACAPTLLRIRRILTNVIEQIPKEKRMQLTVAPIHLAGGFSDVPGLPELLSARLGQTVRAHPNSLRAAYDGAATVLSELNDLTPIPTKRLSR